IVSSFLTINKISSVKNEFILSYIISEEFEDEYLHLQNFIKLFANQSFGVEELIEFFEFVISPVDKEINGAVYTPEHIRNYIVDNAIKKIIPNQNNRFIFGDIACGCGGFFHTITKFLR